MANYVEQPIKPAIFGVQQRGKLADSDPRLHALKDSASMAWRNAKGGLPVKVPVNQRVCHFSAFATVKYDVADDATRNRANHECPE